MAIKTRAELEAQFTDQPAGSGRVQHRPVSNNDLRDLIDSVPLLTEVSSGVQAIRLLGPFPVAFNDAGIEGNGKVLAQLDANVVVIRAWAEITAEWGFGAPASFQIVVAPVSDPGNYYYVTNYEETEGGFDIAVQGDATVIVEALPSTTKHATVRPAEAAQLAFIVGPTPSSGAANIYALIAEPAE